MSQSRQYRRFTISRDGTNWLLKSGLRSGERPIGYVSGWHPYYQVRGRSTSGHSRGVVFGAGVLSALLLGQAGNGSWGGRGSSAPKTVLFGTEPDCTAVVNPEDPELESSPSMWVVTDLRLRYLEFIPNLPEHIRAEAVARTGYDHLPSEPVQPATRLEVSSSELQHTAGLTRQFGRRFKTREAAYDRFTFADGSGIDLRVDALEPINAL